MRLVDKNGYSLIELIVVLVIIGVLVSIALKSLTAVNSTTRYEKTKSELDQLAIAIVGDSKLVSGGSRTDFGYVGDVGALPPNLDALNTNPGGYSTWKGPYINDPFSTNGSNSLYKQDAWGTNYSYSGGLTIVSSGGPTTITRELAVSTSVLLYNPVSATITDQNNTPPGTTYKDSIRVLLSYPNGSGTITTTTAYPGADGFIQFDSIPVGNHLLQMIYLPTADTLTRRVTINSGERYYADLSLYSDYWTGSGGGGGGGSGAIQYVNGSAYTHGGNCDHFHFNITNTSSSAISISNINVSWTSPTAYYEKVKWANATVVNENNPRASSGNTYNFINSKSILTGETIAMKIEKFKNQATGGNVVNIANTDFTITFSDGSVITFNSNNCL